MERIRPGSEEDEWDEEVEVDIGPVLVLVQTIQEMARLAGWLMIRNLEGRRSLRVASSAYRSK
jgi:hypothetical protein